MTFSKITIFLILTSVVSTSFAQNSVSTAESLEWINSKIPNYSVESIITAKVEINSNDELIIMDVRGNYSSDMYYTLQKIKLNDIYIALTFGMSLVMLRLI